MSNAQLGSGKDNQKLTVEQKFQKDMVILTEFIQKSPSTLEDFKKIELVAQDFIDYFSGEFQDQSSNPNSPTFKIMGLIDHDAKKPFSYLRIYPQLIEGELKKGGRIEDTPQDWIDIINRNLGPALETMKVVKAILEGQQNFSADNLAVMHGFKKETESTYTRTVRGKTTTLNIYGNVFDTPEKFFTASTLLGNAVKQSNVSNIKVSVINEGDNKFIEVIDDELNGMLPANLITGIKNSFITGLALGARPTNDSNGGAKLASLYAAQRLFAEHPEVANEDFIKNISNKIVELQENIMGNQYPPELFTLTKEQSDYIDELMKDYVGVLQNDTSPIKGYKGFRFKF